MSDALDVPTVAIRFALYANLMVLFGLSACRLYAAALAKPTGPAARVIRRSILILAITALLLSVVGLIALCAAMAGMPIMQVDRETVDMVLTQTPIGAAWIVRMAALLAIAATSIVRRWNSVVTLLCAGIALATLAWTGHGAAGEGSAGWIQLAADIAHLLAAGVWIGALALFAVVLGRPVRRMTDADVAASHAALDRFALVGTLVVAVLIATGLISSAMLVGIENVATLPSTLYGQLLMIKLMLFAAMLVLAAANRWRLTPALGRCTDLSDRLRAVTALRRSLAAETAAALVILGLVAWLGTLSPPLAA